MEEQIQFKIRVSEKYLAKIPKTLPRNNIEKSRLEENSQAFLFFASGVIEILKRQINDRFGIFDKQNVFYIYGLQKNLQNFGIQKKVKKKISDYFTTPVITPVITPKINQSKSGLWKLQALRNQAMHGNVISVSGQYLKFSYTVHTGRQHMHFTQKTKNPNAYFQRILQDLKKFSSNMEEMLKLSD